MPDPAIDNPTATAQRALLDDRRRELYDWLAGKITGTENEAKFFATMVLAVACHYPDIKYWEAVEFARHVSSLADAVKQSFKPEGKTDAEQD